MDFEGYFSALRGRDILVMGLGVSNRPLVRLLLAHGCRVTACDKTPREKLDAEALALEAGGCTLHVGEHYLEGLAADVVFRTPGMHPDTPALAALRAAGAVVTSEMDAFFSLCPCRTIAVTGSDGKTTTTTLIGEILKAAGKTVWLGGNIGTPLLEKVPLMRPENFAVVELSSFQLLDMTHSPEIAVVTNLAPNHLDIHKDMDEYIRAKKNVFRFQSAAGKLIVNADNAITAPMVGNGKTERFSRAAEADCCCLGGKIYLHGDTLMDASEILLPGTHNIENYMAAILATSGLASASDVRGVARSFGGVEHRIELVRTVRGVRYYNDSIASSPSRTIAGLRAFPEKVILIAGGYDKHIPYDVLGPEIAAHVKLLVLGGATGAKIREAAETAENCPPIVECANFTEAVYAAARAARPGDTVLMSPASAAIDQFINFMERGNYFKKLVWEME